MSSGSPMMKEHYNWWIIVQRMWWSQSMTLFLVTVKVTNIVLSSKGKQKRIIVVQGIAYFITYLRNHQFDGYGYYNYYLAVWFYFSKLASSVVSLFTSNYVFNWGRYFPSTNLKYPPSFDSRVVLYPTTRNVRDYLSWRQVDCKYVWELFTVYFVVGLSITEI